MESTALRLSQLPQTTKLFSDYLDHFERVAEFYTHSPHDPASFSRATERIDCPPERRAAMVAALAEQNGDLPALATLAQPGAVAVVTGQQVGLFSGPCYSIYKALTALNLARQLSDSGIPAAPVFWLATEDHDFAEVNHCWVFDAAHQPVRLEVSTPDSERRPVGGIPIERPPIEALAEAMKDFPFAEETIALVAKAYQPGATMGAAFAALFRQLLPGLLILDPMQPAMRRLAAPLLRQAVEAAPRLAARLAERNNRLVAAGYHAQVQWDENTSLVFLLENGKRLTLDRRDRDYAALAARADDLSPNALLRPVVQDFMLPTVAYVGGPAEIAYFAQSQVIYAELGRPMPVEVSRQGATLLDARSTKRLERYHLSLPDFFEGEQAVRERIAATLVPPELASAIAKAQSTSASALDSLGAALTGFDPTLVAAFATSRRKITWQLSKIERKTARESLRRNQRVTADAAALTGLLCPQKHLQERFYSILPFLARHGTELIDRLSQELTPAAPDHRILTL
jgi:bacillithiol biosynthesis cysteine-adding enzyme BshC